MALWTLKQACRYLSVSPSTLRRLRKANPEQLGAVRLGHQWRYTVSAVKALASPAQTAVDRKRAEILTRASV